ncbi:MAG: RagB/SusD family nutrient uptake outer membrane protein [Candidatus Symbiothrix sp.]|jgi:hypothetical protein|nr:RagB/SusD family nutrient uptake outer membrane protein [Candidatus Symbiothrix sp.]
MKSIKLVIGLAVFGLCFSTACTDLEPEIYTDVKKETYFQTPAQFSTLIANAYAQLAGEYGYVYREGYWSMQEYTSDEVVVPTRGTDWYDSGVPIKMHTHTWEEDTRDVNNGWSFAFGGVTKCNTVLSNIVNIMGEDESTYNDATKSGIAETKVLRAFYHLLAMDLYGNVHIDDGKRELKQYTRKEVFEWIEQEILDNIDKLDDKVRYGSVTKPVAHTILAKMYLNAEIYTGTPRWADAVTQCDLIIDGGYGYKLNDDYFTTFKKDNTSNMEIIFPIVFDAIYAKGNMFHLMTLHYTQKQVYGFTTDMWNGPCTMKSFYDKYDNADKRKEQWFVGPIQKDGVTLTYSNATLTDAPAIIVPEVTTIQDPTAANTFEGARFIKFEIEPGIEHHANSDFPIYRYADILLMKAEALIRKDGTAGDFLNNSEFQKIRTRAGLAPYTELTLDELLAERGRELAWEGHRRQDLIRFGKFTTGMWEFMSARSSNRAIFPIPRWVLDDNPGIYTQNNWQ